VPELPDVEGFRAVLDRHAAGRTIDRITATDPGVLHGTSAATLGRTLHGRRIGHADRHGKWLLARTVGGPTLVFHFGMTGGLEWAPGGRARHRHDRLVVVTDSGELRYRDQRKLQGVWLARSDEEVRRITGPLGPDALGLSRADMKRALAAKRGGLKAALMDQSTMAGLGNLLSDEILWRAHLHPARAVAALDQPEMARLHRALGTVLRTSVGAGCVPPRPSWLTGARDQESPRCPRCHTALRANRVGGRRSWWCPRCQPPAEAGGH
jgi:formamidopyrimidine-DNA glycosylase